MMGKESGGGGTRRVVFLALGVACTGLAAVGVLVPGLPTTVFLIAASFFFTRGSPRLERRLRDSRWFGPYLLRLAETGGAMPRRAKVAAMLSMWAGIAISIYLLRGIPALQAVTAALGLAGTVAIACFVPTLPAGAARVHRSPVSRGLSSAGAQR